MQPPDALDDRRVLEESRYRHRRRSCNLNPHLSRELVLLQTRAHWRTGQNGSIVFFRAISFRAGTVYASLVGCERVPVIRLVASSDQLQGGGPEKATRARSLPLQAGRRVPHRVQNDAYDASEGHSPRLRKCDLHGETRKKQNLRRRRAASR